MQKPADRYIPRAPKNHGLFGVKFAKNHMIMTNKWPASALNAQYKCMVNLLEKNFEFLNLKAKSEVKKQRNTTKRLKVECFNGRKMLKLARDGDSQRIKNLLQDHRDLQRLYISMPSWMIIENINQRTFVKRKERDRLEYTKQRLTKKYETKLMELSKLQDSKNADPDMVLPNEIAANKCKKDLTNSYTRLKAIRTITKAYEKIIQALRQDAIYYDTVLTSLEADIKEQTNFINMIIGLGLPAKERLKQLTEEYRREEETTRKRAQLKSSYLSEFRKKALKDSEEQKNIVGRSETAQVDLKRYNRETANMHKLRKALEVVEKVINLVKNATLCSRAGGIYPVMKKQVEDNDRLATEVKRQEKERDKLVEKSGRAVTKKLLLIHNMSQQEMDRNYTIADLRESLLDERKKQKDIDDIIEQRGEMIISLKFCFYNIMDTLRHVGKSVRGTFRVYPDPDLRLPMLKFETRPMKSYPPMAFEENIEKLIGLTTEKVSELMKAYKDEKNEEEFNAAKKEYHEEYKKSLIKEDEMEKEEIVEDALQLTGRADPNVPNRAQIKKISAKIVEECSKKDD